MVEDGFSAVWVSGEISGWKKHTSGHCYLKLRDAGAVLCAVLYRGVALRMRFDPKDGMEVIARGRLSVYPPQGQYQLSIEELHPKGLGAQEIALQQLKQKLSGKGYFLPQRKRPLPRYPARIAFLWFRRAQGEPDSTARRGLLVDAHPRMVAEAVWHMERNGLRFPVLHGAVGVASRAVVDDI